MLRRCIGLAAILGLLPCAASCTALFDLNGLSDGGCEGACGDGARGVAPSPVDAAGSNEGTDATLGDAPESCTCVDQPPAPWQGPVAVWRGSGAPAECAGAYGAKVLDAFVGPVGAPAQCGCSCGAPAGATCASSVSATLFSDHTCGTACGTVVLTSGTCPNVQGSCVNVFGIAASPQAAGGTCAPQATKQVPTWSWSGAMRACEPNRPPDRAACGAGQVCMPMPAAPMDPRPCILASGDVACPAGAYTVRHLYYGTATDGRGCAPCTCGPATGVTCSATAQEGCGLTGPTFTFPSTCASLADPGSVELTAIPAPSGGSCAPSAGQPTGSLAPASPTTVCCMP